MFLVSLAGPVVFAKEITQICLSFGCRELVQGAETYRGRTERTAELQSKNFLSVWVCATSYT